MDQRIRTLSALLALVLAVVPATGVGAQTLVDHYTAAMKARADSNFVDYHAEMLRAHALEPGHPVVQIHLARAAAQLGALPEAADWVRRALGQGAWWEVREDPWLAPLLASDAAPALLDASDEVGSHRGRAAVGFELEDHDLMPEGIAFDPHTDAFYLSSTRERSIVRRATDGTLSGFVAPAQDGFLCGLGLDVDAERRRLWAVAAADPALAAFDSTQAGTTGLWCWSLDDGRCLGRWSPEPSETARSFNDVVALPDGGALVTDAAGGNLFRLESDLETFRPLLADGALRGPNGLALRPGGDAAHVSEYAYGITLVDLSTGATERLASPVDLCVLGVDGLVRHGADLYAIQNYAGLDRAVRLTLSEDERAVVELEVLEARHPRMHDPTTAVVAHDALWFIANSHIAGFDRDAPLPSREEWTDVLVLKVDLRPCPPRSARATAR